MALSRIWLASEEWDGPRLRPVPRSRAIRAPYVLRLSPVCMPLCYFFADAVRFRRCNVSVPLLGIGARAVCAIVVLGGEAGRAPVAQLSHLSL